MSCFMGSCSLFLFFISFYLCLVVVPVSRCTINPDACVGRILVCAVCLACGDLLLPLQLCTPSLGSKAEGASEVSFRGEFQKSKYVTRIVYPALQVVMLEKKYFFSKIIFFHLK